MSDSLGWLGDVVNLQRSIVSEGYERTLDAIETQVGAGLTRHRFACGSQVFTWRVPPRWSVRSATVSANGRVLVDERNHPLHLVTHSIPFRGCVSRAELMEHLHTDPARPHAIPYVFAFYRPTWGFCVPHDWLPRFTAPNYEVVVDTELSEDGALEIGELRLEGQSPRALVLSAHLDHPGQVEDGLSGVAALVALIRRFRANGGYRGFFTLRFLFTCETLGALCYLSRFEGEVRRLVEGCIAPEALGNAAPLAFGESFSGDTQLDRAAHCVFTERYATFRREKFLYLLANDDQVFDGPGFLIPSLSIARSPFPEYHTSDDSLAIVDETRFQEGVDAIASIIDLVDNNRIPVPHFTGVPFLTRYGLWFDWCSVPKYRNPLELFLRLLDGKRSTVDLAVESALPLCHVRQFLDVMAQHGLVTLEDPPPIGGPPRDGR
jgi:aminopeptidase-like protein